MCASFSVSVVNVVAVVDAVVVDAIVVAVDLVLGMAGIVVAVVEAEPPLPPLEA